MENPFVARVKIRKLAEAANDKELPPEVAALGAKLYSEDFFRSQQDLPAIPALQLDKDLGVAIKKLEQVEGLMTKLPGLDCGACGSPTCRSLAEDIVQQNAQYPIVSLSSGKNGGIGQQIIASLASVPLPWVKPAVKRRSQRVNLKKVLEKTEARMITGNEETAGNAGGSMSRIY